MNALAHGADSLYTAVRQPGLGDDRAARRRADRRPRSTKSASERDRAALPLGSILCGYAIDSGRFGLHHVVCQTLVRVCGSPHAETNAAILPRALAFLAARRARRAPRRASAPRSETDRSRASNAAPASASSAATTSSARRSRRCCSARSCAGPRPSTQRDWSR